MKLKSCIQVNTLDFRTVFSDRWWNDQEDVCCIPVCEIMPEDANLMLNNPAFEGWPNVDFIIGIDPK